MNNHHLSEKGLCSFFCWHLLCLAFLFRTRFATRHKVLCSLEAQAAHKEVLLQCKVCSPSQRCYSSNTCSWSFHWYPRSDITQVSLEMTSPTVPPFFFFFKREAFHSTAPFQEFSVLFFLLIFTSPQFCIQETVFPLSLPLGKPSNIQLTTSYGDVHSCLHLSS